MCLAKTPKKIEKTNFLKNFRAKRALNIYRCRLKIESRQREEMNVKLLDVPLMARRGSGLRAARRRGRRDRQSYFGNVSRGIMPSTADGTIGPF